MQCFSFGSSFSKADSRVTASDEVEKFIGIFANERFEMVAGNIVPFHSILVKVVEDSQARFVVTLYRNGLCK